MLAEGRAGVLYVGVPLCSISWFLVMYKKYADGCSRPSAGLVLLVVTDLFLARTALRKGASSEPFARGTGTTVSQDFACGFSNALGCYSA